MIVQRDDGLIYVYANSKVDFGEVVCDLGLEITRIVALRDRKYRLFLPDGSHLPKAYLMNKQITYEQIVIDHELNLIYGLKPDTALVYKARNTPPKSVILLEVVNPKAIKAIKAPEVKKILNAATIAARLGVGEKGDYYDTSYVAAQSLLEYSMAHYHGEVDWHALTWCIRHDSEKFVKALHFLVEPMYVPYLKFSTTTLKGDDHVTC